jgi:hypothetical protein
MNASDIAKQSKKGEKEKQQWKLRVEH